MTQPVANSYEVSGVVRFVAAEPETFVVVRSTRPLAFHGDHSRTVFAPDALGVTSPSAMPATVYGAASPSVIPAPIVRE
jgi:hypothetical protein